MNTAPSGLIVDTDVGFDDLLAISYLLTQPSIQIEAFTVVNGISDVQEGVKALLLLQENAGLETAIPVFKGGEAPLSGHNAFPGHWRHQASEVIKNQGWGDPKGKSQPVSAVDFLIDRLQDKTKPVQILAIGPLTNIGAVLRQTSGSAEALERLLIMGGAVDVPGNIPGHPNSEGNMYVDPLAANIVFTSGVKPDLVPLDATGHVPLDKRFVNSFQSTSALGGIVGEILRTIEKKFIDTHQGYYAWDPLVGMSVAHPAVLKDVAALEISVSQQGASPGQTLRGPGSLNSNVAFNANAEKFRTNFLAAFASDA